jgi:hypothetical protein
MMEHSDRKPLPSSERLNFTDRKDQLKLFLGYLGSAERPPVLVF